MASYDDWHALRHLLALQVELEKRLRNRKDMEAELLSLTASMSDVLHVGHTEAQELAEAVQSTATEAEQVGVVRGAAVYPPTVYADGLCAWYEYVLCVGISAGAQIGHSSGKPSRHNRSDKTRIGMRYLCICCPSRTG